MVMDGPFSRTTQSACYASAKKAGDESADQQEAEASSNEVPLQ
jgi:hypothetical protein